MITEADLLAAAAEIDDAPPAELQRKFGELREARSSRTRQEVLRQQGELDALAVDQQAYREAGHAQATGNLRKAADWYRVAAANDFADAPLRLASVLDALAEEYLTRPESRVATREEMDLVSDAARWYSAAYAAGDLEAAELLDTLIARHDFRRPRARPAAVPGGGKADDGRCPLGGLRKVMELQLAETAAHCGTCQPCLQELILWPVVPARPPRLEAVPGNAGEEAPRTACAPARPQPS